MIALYKNVSEVFKHYEQVALRKVKGEKLTVLKTDLFNESARQVNNKNILKSISKYIFKGYGIELDKSIFDEAVKNLKGLTNVELILGSITKLPIRSNSIDLLLDFSTIDHVMSYEKALKEYKRVVKSGGELVVIVWLSDETDHVSYFGQYCFNREGFEKILKKYFNCNKKCLLLTKGIRGLIEYDLGISGK